MKAIITGSGFEAASFGTVLAEHSPQSSLGAASDKVVELEIGPRRFMWLRRHGPIGGIAPHRINYRANIHALAELGVTQVIALNTVGGISGECQAGCFVVPDQILDLSWDREASFFDGEFLPLKHIDFTHPYDQDLRQKLLASAAQLSLPILDGGVYACTRGPRLETASEIMVLKGLRADVVGMTAMPEAALARELDIAYASLCLVVNRAAGLDEAVLEEKNLRAKAGLMMGSVTELIKLAMEL
tara:strand:+ start:32090 stop:32821 length:732 start_codon:yes stop_codon:yes gene_type:complete